MTELLEVAHQILESGITWSSCLAIVLAVLKIRDTQHKRRVAERTQRDISEIKEALGICSVTISDNASTSGAKKRSALFLQHLAVPLAAAIARQSIISRRNTTMKVNKLILIPLLSAIAEFIKQLTGYEVPVPWMDLSADVILWLISIIGIRMKWHIEGGDRLDANIQRSIEHTE